MLVRRTSWLVCALLAVALAATLVACGETTADSEQAATGDDGVKMGPGVTEDTIKIGAILDLSGPFSPVGKTYRRGAELFWSELNADGGVCGRKVDYVIQDYGLDTQRGVTAYEAMRDEVLGIENVHGGPLMSAILKSVERDEMLGSPVTWTADLLSSKSVLMVGPTYEVQVANGVDYYAEQEGVLSEGDTIGVIRHEGTYGEAVLAGAQSAGERLGIKTIDKPIEATDADLTAEVSALRSAGAKLIVLGTASKQVASAVSASVAANWDVPFLGASPGIWDPGLLRTSVGPALERQLLIASGEAPYSSDEPGPTRIRELYEREVPDGEPDFGIIYGYAQAQVFTEVLKAACEAEDLSRAGVLEARMSLDAVDTGGAVVELDYSELGVSPSPQSFMVRPDSGEPGGLSMASGLLTAK